MKLLIASLFGLLLPLNVVLAEDDESKSTTIITIQDGKFVGEQHEIEIYDYHSGVYQTVNVYRKPAQTPKAEPAKPIHPEPTKQ